MQRSIEKRALCVPESEIKDAYYCVLARTIAAVSQDHSHLRAMLYERALIELKSDVYQRAKELGWSGIEQHVHALEAAIAEIEADFVEKAIRQEKSSEPETDYASRAVVIRPEPGRVIIANDYAAPIRASLVAPFGYDLDATASVPAVREQDRDFTPGGLAKHFRATFWSTVQLIAAAALGVAIYAALTGQTNLAGLTRSFPLGQPTKESGSTGAIITSKNDPLDGTHPAIASSLGAPQNAPNIPLPTTYGVYALAGGKLTRLEPLPISVPDPRVAISAAISMPSRAHVPHGELQFVAFRRDLVNSAPDHVALRVVAQIVRALTFDARGQASVSDVPDSWVVRGKSYAMRVAPVSDNPAMIVIRPDNPQLVLPAGRYAMVLKGVGYDLTIDGPIRDAAHCLERTDALQAPVYTECRNP